MEQEKRIKYFTKLLAEKVPPYGSMEVWYKNQRQKMPVYEINLDYLVYNRYNSRIASVVKSYEKQTGNHLNPTVRADIEKIEDFLWKSNISSNKNTHKSIKEQGQLKYGIVTKDGVIIDGNRRAMILNQVNKETQANPGYFLAVVLEETLDENPKEIKRLETTYQMGEDAKVDYNPIEKYLTCEDLKNYDFSSEEISKIMSEPPAKIDEYLAIMALMNDYLEKLGYSGIYTRLDKTEGAFVDLYNYLARYQGGRSKVIQWNYDDSDVLDLKLIYFDYIRGIYNRGKSISSDSGDSKDYRFIGQTSKKGSFFTNKHVWEKFRDEHFENMDFLRENEDSIEALMERHESLDLDQILRSRDQEWAKTADPQLKKNLGKGREALDNLNKQNEPLELLLSAKSKLESIDPQIKPFLEDERILAVVKEIGRMMYDYQKLISKYSKST